MKTAATEEVAAITARPTSLVPTLAAFMGSSPASTWRKMFSITTMASSITIPTESDMASIVRLFTVNPSAFMSTNPPISEMGIAVTLMKVTLIFLRKRYMIRAVRMTPNIMSNRTPSIDSLINPEVSRAIPMEIPTGVSFLIVSSFAFTASMTAVVLVPDCFLIPRPIAGRPLNRAIFLRSSNPSSIFPSSFRLIVVPSRSATTRFFSSSTEVYSPLILTLYSFSFVSIRPPGISRCFN